MVLAGEQDASALWASCKLAAVPSFLSGSSDLWGSAIVDFKPPELGKAALTARERAKETARVSRGRTAGT